MTVSPKLKNIIESHDEDLDTQKYDNIVRDAVREDVLDELFCFLENTSSSGIFEEDVQ